jgi:hypothetical protein
MKAITICQPYAAAIMSGAKKVENRNWFTSHRGPLAIHAGKSKSWMDDFEAVSRSVPGLTHDSLMFGALLGFVQVIDCKPVTLYEHQYGYDEWAYGEFCWVLRNPVMLRKPLVMSGKLGLFDVPDDALEDVTR